MTPAKLNPRWVELAKAGINPCPYFQLQSMRLTALEPGVAELAIDLQAKHLQPFGVVHGGVLAGLLDAACFWACFTLAPAEAGMTTVDLKLNYLAPLLAGDKAVARGQCVRLGRSLGLGEAKVFDADGRVLAHGSSTVMVMPDMAMPGQEAMPPKFLD